MEVFSQNSKNSSDAEELYEQLKVELELLDGAGDPFDLQKILDGKLSPVFFGSAMNNFGVERFLKKFLKISPPPVARNSTKGKIEPTLKDFSGFIFKIQANMDPQHRDRVAFIRVCSGRFEKNMMVEHVRLGKKIKLSRPLNFFAQERVLVEEAYPGDIVGLVDTTGNLRIGDTLCEKGGFAYDRVPSFSPEFFARAMIKDPLKRKQLKKGLDQLSEEGVVQVYAQRGMGDKDPLIAAVGALQFEVLKSRLQSEYSVDVNIENLPYTHARWVSGPGFDPSFFEHREDSLCVLDRDENFVVLFKSEWAMKWAQDNSKDVEFKKTIME